MRRIPPISSWMTAFPRHLEPATTVGEARHIMLAHDIHHVPVTGAAGAVGVVTFHQLPPDDSLTVDRVAQDAVVVDATERVDNVVERMAREHLPVVVVVYHQRLAGIFTWTDACRHCARLLREPFLPPEGDDVA